MKTSILAALALFASACSSCGIDLMPEYPEGRPCDQYGAAKCVNGKSYVCARLFYFDQHGPRISLHPLDSTWIHDGACDGKTSGWAG